MRLTLVAALMLGHAVGAAGCRANRTDPVARGDVGGIRQDARREVVRTGVNEYLMDFTARVRVSADRIAAEATDDGVRRNALLWKLNAIPAMREACFRPDPLSALFDAWAFTAQMHVYFEEGLGRDLFGEQQPIAVEAVRTLHDDVRDLWRSIATDDEAMEAWENDQVNAWVEEHPIEDLSFARPSSIGQFADLSRDRGGAIQRVKNLDEQVAVLTQQARLYLANLHHQLRGEVRLIINEVLDDDHFGSLSEQLERISDAAQRAATLADQTPALVQHERAAILEAIDEQRQRVTEDLRAERDAIISTLAAERAIVLDAIREERRTITDVIASERLSVMGGVDDQRRDTLAWIDRELEDERAIVMDDLGTLVASSMEQANGTAASLLDAITRRVIVLLVAIVLLTPVVAHVYVKVWPARGRA